MAALFTLTLASTISNLDTPNCIMPSIVIREVFYGNSTPVFTRETLIRLFISGNYIEEVTAMASTPALITEMVITISNSLPIRDSIDRWNTGITNHIVA